MKILVLIISLFASIANCNAQGDVTIFHKTNVVSYSDYMQDTNNSNNFTLCHNLLIRKMEDGYFSFILGNESGTTMENFKVIFKRQDSNGIYYYSGLYNGFTLALSTPTKLSDYLTGYGQKSTDPSLWDGKCQIIIYVNGTYINIIPISIHIEQK